MDHVAQVAADAFQQLRGPVQGATGVLHGLAYIAGFPAALFGELVHLVGDDREAAPVYPRTCRLDGGVEGEQIRLVGDGADGLGELLDLRSDFPQPRDFGDALLRR